MKLIHFQKKYSGIIIAFILFLITVFVYTYKIDQITPGMFADEIAVGQMSEKLYKLPLTPFLPDNYGHPTPQLYIIGAVIKTFGRTVFNLRITSIIFAALSISIFYLLLRNYLNKTLSLLVSIMFMCSYPFIVVSRFAYEMSAAILFQILSLLFLIKYYKSKKIQDVVGFSFTISFGLYSYLSFRLTAIPLIIAMIALIVFNHMSFPRFTRMTILFSVILIITLPLNIYSFQHPDQVWARTNTISIFNQKFSPTEFRK
ncbi:MAG: glycosyltransferase family 39 protein, partial [bacterium]|nr:glycosyltransferase family 39 protein [bacterium]